MGKKQRKKRVSKEFENMEVSIALDSLNARLKDRLTTQLIIN